MLLKKEVHSLRQAEEILPQTEAMGYGNATCTGLSQCGSKYSLLAGSGTWGRSTDLVLHASIQPADRLRPTHPACVPGRLNTTGFSCICVWAGTNALECTGRECWGGGRV